MSTFLSAFHFKRSWLNMVEIELNVLMEQCLNRWIDNIEVLNDEVEAWQNARNKDAKINLHSQN